MTPEEDDIQEKRHQFILMQQLAQTQSLQKGKEEGLKEGLEKGVQKGKKGGLKEGVEKGIHKAIIKSATAMIKAGTLSGEQIIEYSGINQSDFDELKAELEV